MTVGHNKPRKRVAQTSGDFPSIILYRPRSMANNSCADRHRCLPRSARLGGGLFCLKETALKLLPVLNAPRSGSQRDCPPLPPFVRRRWSCSFALGPNPPPLGRPFRLAHDRAWTPHLCSASRIGGL